MHNNKITKEELLLSFTADLPTIAGILSIAQEWVADIGLMHEDALSLRLVLEELLTNIAFHSKSKDESAGKSLPVKISLSVKYKENIAKKFFKIIIQDTGKPFNPLEYKVKDVNSITNTSVGQRGLALVHLLTTSLHYTYQNLNSLSFLLPLETNNLNEDTIAKSKKKEKIFKKQTNIINKLRSLWAGNLAFKYTIIFTTISYIILATGIYIFYNAGREIVYDKIAVFAEQTLHTQSVISSTYLDRVGEHSTQLAEQLGKTPSEELFNDNAKELDNLLKEGNYIRLIVADSSIYGIIAGKGEKSWYFPLVDNVPTQVDFDHKVDLELTPPGEQGLWQTLNINFFEDDPYASMVYANALTDNPEDGWVGVVVGMPWIAETLYHLSGFKNACPLYFDSKGQYIIYPPGRKLGEGPQSLKEEAELYDIPELLKMHNLIINGEIGIYQLPLVFGQDETIWPLPWEGPASFVHYPMQTEGWFLGLLVDSRELGNIVFPFPLWLIWYAVIAPLLIGALTWFVTSSTLRPLHNLTIALKRMATGELDTPLPKAEYPDELGSMLNDFEKVRVTLRSSFRNLVENTKIKQRIDNELLIAHNIQESILPHSFPQNSHYQVHASLTMAQEVCGDLYDCFVHPKNPSLWYFVIGDVCGKGIPAALIMSRAISLTRSFLLNDYTPAECLERVNHALLRRDNSLMFITMCTGILNIETGEFTWASAGHPPPLVINKEHAKYLSWSNELVLGVRPNQSYSSFTHTLEKDEAILLYTDGANEALSPPNNQEGEVFGDENLKLSFENAWKEENTPQAIIDKILKDLFSYMQYASPTDDISLLTITRSEKKLDI